MNIKERHPPVEMPWSKADEPSLLTTLSGNQRRWGRKKRSEEAIIRRKARRAENQRTSRRLHRLFRSSQEPTQADGESSAETKKRRCVGEEITSLQCNVNGFRSNGAEFIAIVEEKRPMIAAACEMKIDQTVPSTLLSINNYELAARKDRTAHGGGVAMWTRKDVNYSVPFVDDSIHEVVWILIHASCGPILVASCYVPRNHSEFFDYMTSKVLAYTNEVISVIILGDFNASEGSAFSAMRNFLHNTGTRTHVTAPTRLNKVLDQVITDFDDSRVKTTVLPPVSDHSPVVSSYDASIRLKKPTRRRVFMYSRAKWISMRRFFERTDWQQLLGKCNANNAALRLTKKIKEAILLFIPSRHIKNKNPSVPWWNEKCNAALKKKLSNTNITNNSDLRNCIMKAKVEYNKRTKAKLSKMRLRDKKWWSIIRRNTGFSKQQLGIPSLQVGKNKFIHSDSRKCNAFAKILSSREPPVANGRPELPERNPVSLSYINVREREVNRLLRLTDPNRASGIDDISPRVLKMCCNELASPCCIVYRKIINEKSWPTSWKKARTVMLHKKSSRSNASNYRGIFLLSSISKILEKIICNRIMCFLERSKCIPESQFAYRKNRGSQDLAAYLSGRWLQAMNDRQKIAIYNADVRQAFDRVNKEILLMMAEQLGLRDQLLALLSDYLRSRTFIVNINGCSSSTAAVENSIVQGSNIGPVFWIIFFCCASLPSEKNQFEDVQFADDKLGFRVYDASVSDEDIMNDIKKCQKDTHSWGERMAIIFDAAKENLIIINGSSTASDECESFKFVGVDYDLKLSMKKQCSKMVKNAQSRVKALLRARKIIGDSATITSYKAFCRPLMEYAPAAISHAIPGQLHQFEKVQDLLVRNVSNPGRLSSLETRREVSIQGMLRKVARNEAPVLLQKLIVKKPAAQSDQAMRTRRQIRQANHGLQFHLPSTNRDIAAFRRSFLYKSVNLWNDLPADVVKETNRSNFSRLVMNILEI
jgi:hypothetical protein